MKLQTLAPLLLLGLAMTLAPTAVGDETKPACPEGTVETPEGCSQQAWVDDCPPDMLCAAGAPDDGNETGNATDEPISYGPDDCIECSGPIDSGSCMDGTATDCRDDVQYIGGPGGDTGAEPVRGPEDGSCENCRGDDAATADREAVGMALAAGLALLAVLAAILRR